MEEKQLKERNRKGGKERKKEGWEGRKWEREKGEIEKDKSIIARKRGGNNILQNIWSRGVISFYPEYRHFDANIQTF